MEQQKNCRNCGAPLNEHGDCEYCGTKGWQEKETFSEIVITVDSIRLGTNVKEAISRNAARYVGI